MDILGQDAFSDILTYPLSRPADDATISVTVAGQTVAQFGVDFCQDGWTYDPMTNTIVFGDNAAPNRGDDIEVQYTAACF